ncbi:MAG: acyltransferase family protein [Actinomycetota bacterium]|nr:acyltransferase family protein [Actinomycetota bacterium]
MTNALTHPPLGDRIPALEGVRALAVLLVLGFHGGLGVLGGGHLGVDVFFVLSGFVITRGLLQETRTTGRISLARFWARRSARLVPAAVLSVVAGGVLFAFLSSPKERVEVATDGQASLVYLANWRFISQATSYFKPTVQASPFLHMWSLSVEEQFYVVWPLTIAGLSWVLLRWRRTPTPSVWLLGSLALAATAWTARVIAVGSEAHAYYGTDARAYQLLWGAALAAAMSGGWTLAARAARWVAPVAAVAVVWLAVQPFGSGPTRGMYVTAPALLLCAALSSPGGGFAARVLASPPMVWLGGLSYAVYLWHWHLVVALDRVVVASAPVRTAVISVGSIGLAMLSATVVEGPVRRWVHGHSRDRTVALGVVAGGLTMAMAATLALAPLMTSGSFAMLRAADRPGFSRTAALSASETPIPERLNSGRLAPYTDGEACINVVVTDQQTCRAVDGAGLTVLVVGDSHIGDLLPGFSATAAAQGATLHLITVAGCPWQQGLATVHDSEKCVSMQDALYGAWLDDLAPDVVVLGGHPLLEREFRVHRRGGAEQLEVGEVTSATTTSLELVSAPGRAVVVLGPRPSAPFDSTSCIGAARFQEECMFAAAIDATAQEDALLEALGADSDVTYVSMATLLCPRLPICDPIVDGLLVRSDKDHVYPVFAQHLAPALWAVFEAAATGG